jgi:hypothetical protein
MSWQRVYLPLKSYVVDVDNQVVAWCQCWVMLVMVLPGHAGDEAAKVIW